MDMDEGQDKTEIYQGLLSMHSWGEADDVLYLSSLKDPLAEELGWMRGKQVTVRYWITDKQCTRNEAVEAAMLIVMGVADVKLNSRYSEGTGYLWTDEDLNIGGHDLLSELKGGVGKWLILEVCHIC